MINHFPPENHNTNFGKWAPRCARRSGSNDRIGTLRTASALV
jgi:hypothetical protein